jgi:hypothetical protein
MMNRHNVPIYLAIFLAIALILAAGIMLLIPHHSQEARCKAAMVTELKTAVAEGWLQHPGQSISGYPTECRNLPIKVQIHLADEAARQVFSQQT